jgi:hypothetical protein
MAGRSPRPVFFMSPGQLVAAGAQFVDWSSDWEVKNWKSGTKGLEDKFNLKQENLVLFLNRVNEKSQAYNWNPIVDVPHQVEGRAS